MITWGFIRQDGDGLVHLRFRMIFSYSLHLHQHIESVILDGYYICDDLISGCKYDIFHVSNDMVWWKRISFCEISLGSHQLEGPCTVKIIFYTCLTSTEDLFYTQISWFTSIHHIFPHGSQALSWLEIFGILKLPQLYTAGLYKTIIYIHTVYW